MAESQQATRNSEFKIGLVVPSRKDFEAILGSLSQAEQSGTTICACSSCVCGPQSCVCVCGKCKC